MTNDSKIKQATCLILLCYVAFPEFWEQICISLLQTNVPTMIDEVVLQGSSGLRRKGVVGKEGTNVHGKLQPILSVSVMYGTHPLDVLASWTLLQKSFSVSLFEGLIPS